MRKLSLFVAAVAASLAFAGAAKALPSSGAAPLGTAVNTEAAQNSAAATQVQYRRYYRHRHWRPYRYYGYRPYRPYYGYYGYRPYRWHRHHHWRRYW
jgi:hypothetical protein